MSDHDRPESGTMAIDELVDHLNTVIEDVRLEWIRAMRQRNLIEGLSDEEAASESSTINRIHFDCLRSGDYTPAERYARGMAEEGGVREMTAEQIIGGFFTLRELYRGTIFEGFEDDSERLRAALNTYEAVADQIVAVVALAFVEERERVVSQQQTRLQELSTPVLQIRDRLLLLPIIGLVDSHRARQFTENLLEAIRESRARAVVVDITGVAAVDTAVANRLLQTAEAARLMGARVILTGMSADVARTLVTLGVDLGDLNTVGDLQGGIDEADRLLGYEVVGSGRAGGASSREEPPR